MIALCFFFFTVCHGLIEKLSVENDDRRNFVIESFGFESNGSFEVSIKDFVLMVPHNFVAPKDDKFNIAFVLQSSQLDGPNQNIGREEGDESSTSCFHVDNIKPGDIVISMAARSDWTSLKYATKIEEAGFYHLWFSNCEPTTQVTFELELTEYNVNSKGEKSYINAGEEPLPTWYAVICVLFAVELVVWCCVLRSQRDNVKSIHLLMTLCLCLKIATMFCEAFKEHSVKATGVKTDGWTYLFYIFSFLKGMLMFTVIVLIGTGWSYLKPFLTER